MLAGNSALSRRALLGLLPAAAMLPRSVFAAPATPRLFIGTGTKGSSKGIYVADWSPDNGVIGPLTLAAAIESPTFLARSPVAPQLFALSEIDLGKVTAFRYMQPPTTLTQINRQPSGGSGPAHVSVHPDGGSVYVANYGGGSISSYRVEPGGALSVPVSQFSYNGSSNTPTTGKSHAHCVTPSPDGRWLLVNDLGLERILVYRIDPHTATLTANDPPFWQARAGSGPRHLAFHPNARWAYSVNELDSTIDLLNWDASAGTLTPHGSFVSTLPPGFPKNTAFASEILVSPDGKFVYAGNRRNETIAMLTVNPADGTLALAQLAPHGGKTARHITLDPSGRWLLVADQDSGGIAVLARDPSTGKLSTPAHTYAVDSPQCLAFSI